MLAAVDSPLNLAGLAGTLQRDEPMARHTSWRAGGAAAWYYEPVHGDDLVALLKQLPAAGLPPLFVGLGSNLLVRDGGWPGMVVALQRGLRALRQIDQTSVRVEAGVTCAAIARHCARLGLAGGEFLAGIPGTIGGALAMNAGAHGGETWQVVEAVTVVDTHGRRQQRTADHYQVGYRQVSGGEGTWFLDATLRFAPAPAQQVKAEVRKVLSQRRASQPLHKPSAGSVFRNPPGDYAARLIEAAGLKGQRVGNAEISRQHANFILNLGGATAADIEALMNLVRREVAEQSGVVLEPEVRIVGLAP